MPRRPKKGSAPVQEELFGPAPPPWPSPAPPPVERPSPHEAHEALPRAQGGLKLPEALRLECNLALFAGAGAGKTHSLVTAALHLLGGARAVKPAVAPSGLWMLTFTDKAAGEMRERLRERLDALARGAEREPDLEASFAALGRDFPSPHAWRELRDGLGSAFIGTFHGLCTALLRQAPGGATRAPSFELLDERRATALATQQVERLVLERAARGDAPVRDLLRELGFQRLLDALHDVHQQVREEGLRPDLLPIQSRARAREALEQRLVEAASLAAELPAALAQRKRGGKPDAEARYREVAALAASVLASVRPEDVARPGSVPALEEALSQVRIDAFGQLKSAVRGDGGRPSLLSLYGAMVVADHEVALRDLLVELDARHRAALERQGVLDFTGLLAQARELLRDVPEARRDAHQRCQALLVDEFQDTNGLQLDLVHLLAEERSGGPRPLTPGALSAELRALPLEPAALCIVGDRKQGIYEFRGADVSLMEQCARTLERSKDAPGGRAWLQESRRSTPALVDFVNAAAPAFMATAASPARDYEVVFDPRHDALRAHAGEGPVPRPVLQLEAAVPADAEGPDVRALDARAVALAVDRLTRDGVPRVQTRTGARPARLGDVALLFERFTHVEVYQQALVHAGVRHRVVQGRGFYGAQEITDLASLLSLVADADDQVACAAVLRSPLVGLTDASLFRLAVQGGGPLRPLQVLLTDDAVDLPGPDLARLLAFRALFRALRAERHRLGVTELLEAVLSGAGLRERLAATPHGEQALANLEKLLALAARRDAQGAGDCAAFARELLELARKEPSEAQGDAVEAGDAVTLCTIHQAKGLEWPIVVVPELFATPRGGGPRVVFERHLGLAVAPWPVGGVELRSATHEAVAAELKRRAAAERQRKLYVALTRARDLVVLGLRPPKQKGHMLAALLDPARAVPAAAARLEVLDVDGLPPLRPAPPPALPADAALRLDQVEARVARRPPLPPRALLPVTQLQDFDACPRRFHLVHQVGLEERPRDVDPLEHGEHGDGDPRALGITVHRLLEVTPLALVGRPRLRGELLALARAEALPAAEEAVDLAAAFWDTRFGREVAAAGPAQVLREVPFVLRLGGPGQPALLLRGQMDLLLLGAHGDVAVLDYKTARRPASGLERYQFQLRCYALAAEQLRPAAGRVRAGVAFLKEPGREPEWSQPGPAELEAWAARLPGLGEAMLRAQAEGAFPGRPAARCRELGCGHLSRCHPAG